MELVRKLTHTIEELEQLFGTHPDEHVPVPRDVPLILVVPVFPTGHIGTAHAAQAAQLRTFVNEGKAALTAAEVLLEADSRKK